MASHKSVMNAFIGVSEARQTALLPYGRESLPASRQQLVGVTLVSDVPQNLIGRTVEDPVQGNGQLDGSRLEARCPPLAEILPTSSLLSSAASFCNCSGGRLLRSAG